MKLFSSCLQMHFLLKNPLNLSRINHFVKLTCSDQNSFKMHWFTPILNNENPQFQHIFWKKHIENLNWGSIITFLHFLEKIIWLAPTITRSKSDKILDQKSWPLLELTYCYLVDLLCNVVLSNFIVSINPDISTSMDLVEYEQVCYYIIWYILIHYYLSE